MGGDVIDTRVSDIDVTDDAVRVTDEASMLQKILLLLVLLMYLVHWLVFVTENCMYMYT